jgi:hypothetical protein
MFQIPTIWKRKRRDTFDKNNQKQPHVKSNKKVNRFFQQMVKLITLANNLQIIKVLAQMKATHKIRYQSPVRHGQ